MFQKNSKIVLIFLVLSASFLVNCTGSSNKKVLRVLTWTEYLEEDTISRFEKSHAIRVQRDYFTSNEEMLAKIQFSVQSGNKGYDLILPSDYMVSTMIRQGLLQKIDHSKLSVLKSFSENFLNPSYDPQLAYSLPFAWGTTGVVINTNIVKDFDINKLPLSWQTILENPEYRRQVTLLDDVKENTHVALLIQKKNWETASEADIRSAFEYLKKIRGQIKIYTPEAEPVIEANECGFCMVYSGTGLRIASENPHIQFFIPSEGATLWSDNFAIPVNAANPEWAHLFMDAVLEAHSAAAFTKRTFFPTPNKASHSLLDANYTNNIFIFPSPEIFSRLKYLTDREDLLQLTDRLWTELKSM
jgi:spermidine/putrescine transport system substrate-binding protein